MHRWIAYGLGAIVALWTVTGIVMLYPPALPIRVPAAAGIDPSGASRTPDEAGRALALSFGTRVRSVTLRMLGAQLAYYFVLQDGSSAWVDAATAQRLEFGDSLARELALRAVDGATLGPATRVTQHDDEYRFGALPAFRFELGDASSTLLYVAADGSLTATTTRSRVRGIMAALHEFQVPGNLIPNRLRKLLLFGAGALTIVLVCTGYVLALPFLSRRTN